MYSDGLNGVSLIFSTPCVGYYQPFMSHKHLRPREDSEELDEGTVGLNPEAPEDTTAPSGSSKKHSQRRRNGPPTGEVVKPTGRPPLLTE